MSHFTVLLASKSNDIHSFYKLMDNNDWSDNPEDPQPFGFDYLAPKDREGKYNMNPYIFHKSEVEDIDASIIIDSEGKELWWSNGISDAIPDITYETALALIPEEHYCCLFDGHL